MLHPCFSRRVVLPAGTLTRLKGSLGDDPGTVSVIEAGGNSLCDKALRDCSHCQNLVVLKAHNNAIASTTYARKLPVSLKVRWSPIHTMPSVAHSPRYIHRGTFTVAHFACARAAWCSMLVCLFVFVPGLDSQRQPHLGHEWPSSFAVPDHVGAVGQRHRCHSRRNF